ncbi:MAG: Hsp20/alpha crystallin family protein [Deltaproteobacteria bacterium]
MPTALSTQGSRQLQPLFKPLRALQEEFDELFNRLSSDWNGRWLKSEFYAACDLSETADAFQVRMDVPGIKPDDINVQVTGDTVQISGARKEEKEEKGKMYHRLERRSGKFAETLRLPCAVNEEKVQAEFHEGVLTVTLPKTESTKTRTVKVKAHEAK